MENENNIEEENENESLDQKPQGPQQYSVYFEYQGENGSEERLQEYYWWPRIMERQVARASHFFLECLPGDREGRMSCAKMGAAGTARLRTQGNREIWNGRINTEFKEEFLFHPFDIEGKIKWNSVILKGRERTILSATSNGGRIGIHGVEERDIAFYRHCMKDLSFSLYYWGDVKSGQVVDFQTVYAYDDDVTDIIQAYQRGTKQK